MHSPSTGAEPRRPNIVVLVADQLRSDVFGYRGDEKAITPNIDRLASESVDAVNSTVVTPICAPFRASLLTGKFTSSTGMVINELAMNPNHGGLARALHEAGYDLGFLGKWHLVDGHGRSIPAGPGRLGFEHARLWRAYNFSHDNFAGYFWEDDEDGVPRRVEIPGHQDDAFTRWAIEYITERATGDRPFALFLNWSEPHDPWIPENCAPGYYDRFADVEFPHPATFRDSADPRADRENSAEEWRWWAEHLEDARRCYYAMVNHVDDKVGEVMAALDSSGQADDTIVVLTADHGEMFGAQGRVFKTTFYDEAVTTPLLIRWPGRIPAGSRTTECISTPDLAPSLLGLAGVAAPDDMEGRDLSSSLRGEGDGRAPSALIQGMGHTYLWEDGFEWRALRTARHTYARYLSDGRELLFDNVADPEQTTDLATDPRHAHILAELRSEMAARMNALSDDFRPLSGYRDWMAEDDERSIVANAFGRFAGPHPAIPSLASG